MFVQTQVWFAWPLLPGQPEIRQFARIGPFDIKVVGGEWRVLDTSILNKYGMPDGTKMHRFQTRAAAEQFVREGMGS